MKAYETDSEYKKWLNEGNAIPPVQTLFSTRVHTSACRQTIHFVGCTCLIKASKPVLEPEELTKEDEIDVLIAERRAAYSAALEPYNFRQIITSVITVADKEQAKIDADLKNVITIARVRGQRIKSLENELRVTQKAFDERLRQTNSLIDQKISTLKIIEEIRKVVDSYPSLHK